jgi:hypothetical protein
VKALKIIAIILAVICAILVPTAIVFKTHKRLVYVACDDDYGNTILNEEGLAFKWTNEECRREVEKLFGNPKYIYTEWRLDRSFCLPTFRYIGINDSLTGCYYIQDLTHELVHLTEWVGNERYTNFRTFVILYESDVPELHEAGRRLGRIEYYSDNGGEYDCWYYINEYLKEKNYEKRD